MGSSFVRHRWPFPPINGLLNPRWIIPEPDHGGLFLVARLATVGSLFGGTCCFQLPLQLLIHLIHILRCMTDTNARTGAACPRK